MVKTAKKITIGIVDDDDLIVNLLKSFLNSQEEMDVLMTATNGIDCLAKLSTSENIPEILLMDLKMGKMNGIETTQLLKKKYPTIKTIIVSSHYKISFIGFMLKTGVCAFAPKGISTDSLLKMITAVHENGYYFDVEQLEIIRNQLSSKFPKPVLEQENLLSEREVEILKLLCDQKTAKEIGDTLFITKRTVEGHKNNLFAKTGAKNIAGLVIYAIQNDIINANNLPII